MLHKFLITSLIVSLYAGAALADTVPEDKQKVVCEASLNGKHSVKNGFSFPRASQNPESFTITDESTNEILFRVNFDTKLDSSAFMFIREESTGAGSWITVHRSPLTSEFDVRFTDCLGAMNPNGSHQLSLCCSVKALP